MNCFGRIFKISIFGESHGECVGVLIDGIPPGIAINTGDFEKDIETIRSYYKGVQGKNAENFVE